MLVTGVGGNSANCRASELEAIQDDGRECVEDSLSLVVALRAAELSSRGFGPLLLALRCERFGEAFGQSADSRRGEGLRVYRSSDRVGLEGRGG